MADWARMVQETSSRHGIVLESYAGVKGRVRGKKKEEKKGRFASIEPKRKSTVEHEDL